MSVRVSMETTEQRLQFRNEADGTACIPDSKKEREKDTTTQKLMMGDCLERMKEIPTGSVDLVLCDLPYGTTNNTWDSVIPAVPLWAEYARLCTDWVILSAAQPFTSSLVLSSSIKFRYSLIWEKSRPSGFLNARRAPLRSHEDVLLFSDGPLKYFPQGLTPVCINQGRKNKAGNGNFSEVSAATYVQTEGNFPRSIIRFMSENHKSLHPTQKPVALMEYLIKTYTNEGDTVLDNCMGSGTTGVACVNTNRNFIGIERDPAYFEICKQRIPTGVVVSFDSILTAASSKGKETRGD